MFVLYQQNQCKPITSDTLLKWITPYLTTAQLQFFGKEGQVDTAITLAEGQRLRVNLFRQQLGISAVLRVINSQLPTLTSLRAPKSITALLDNVSNGLILVTGATGSGKSSTLAAMIDYLNQHKRQHILTLEAPIEFIYTNKQSIIQQREIGRDVQNITSAIEAALRQDPDVIMIGEIRDQQTAEIAIKAAQTGHLVLSTLHTNSTQATLARLANLGIAKDLIDSCVKLIISQRLVRCLCSDCKYPSPEQKNFIINNQQIILPNWQATGCQFCYSGYKGRTAIYDCFELAKQSLPSPYALFNSGIELIKKGITSLDEVYQVVGDIE